MWTTDGDWLLQNRAPQTITVLETMSTGTWSPMLFSLPMAIFSKPSPADK